MLFIAYNRFLSIFQFINRIVTIFAFWVPSSFLYLTKLEGFDDISSKKIFFFFLSKTAFFWKNVGFSAAHISTLDNHRNFFFGFSW